MKKIMLLTLLSAFIIFGAAAQNKMPRKEKTPIVSKRQRMQKNRIREGVQSGELTQAETKQVAHQQGHIRRSKRRMKADGEVTRLERARLGKKQNRANRNIARKKNNEVKKE